MSLDSLRDLEMAGVRWELGEVPCALAAQIAAATVHGDVGAAMASSRPAVASRASTDASIVAPHAPARTPTQIVPPIAPVRPISVETAAAMAARPANMNALLRMIDEFNHPLRAVATNVVLPHVPQSPGPMVIVTDIPGADDDATGRILSGAAGELLDKMLGAIGMSREIVSIVPMLFWRTPGGRTPTRAELDLSRPFVDRALELLHPRVILTLGTTTATEIAGVALARGQGVAVKLDSGAQCMPIFHPNYLLLKPGAKRDVWNALQIVEKMLKSPEL